MLNQFIASNYPHLTKDQQESLADFIKRPQEGQNLQIKLGLVNQFRSWVANS